MHYLGKTQDQPWEPQPKKRSPEETYCDVYFPQGQLISAKHTIRALKNDRNTQTRNTVIGTKRGSYLNYEQNLSESIPEQRVLSNLSPPPILNNFLQDEPDQPSGSKNTAVKASGPFFKQNQKKPKLNSVCPYDDFIQPQSMSVLSNNQNMEFDDSSPTPRTMRLNDGNATMRIRQKNSSNDNLN